jgi:hypothetical protein
MRQQGILAVLCSFIVALGAISLNVTSTCALPSVPFRVEQVAWGTSTATPTEAQPGDTNAPLTIDIRNLSNATLKGVYGTLLLRLDDPFTDYVTGGLNASASGTPLQAGDIFNQTGEILPAGSFSFTFRLNIARTAMPGYYQYSLITEYLIKDVNSTWLLGEPQTLEITILLPNRPPTIDAFAPAIAAPTVQAGDSLNFTAKCSDPDNDSVTFEWKLDAVMVSNTTGFLYAPAEKDVGSHTLVLTTSDGRLTATQTWTITVTTVPISQFFVSSNQVTAGFDNQLNITIGNNLWKGTVEASLTVAQPLVVRGNQSWIFQLVQPSENLSIAPIIYAPETAMGSTFTAALTLDYGDEHGLTYTDTYNVGLIVQGYVRLIVYDVVVSPQPVADGSEITISATALNTGNAIANYANASLQPNSMLELSRESSTYVGEIELNSPVPFTIVARVKADAQNGTYPMSISLTYQDDQYKQYVLIVTANVLIATGAELQPESNGTNEMLRFLSNGGWSIIVVAGAGIALLILYVRRLSRTKQEPKVA